MQFNSLLKNVDISVVHNTNAGVPATFSTDILDMEGYDGVVFIAKLGDVVATAVVTLTAQQDDVNGAGGMATLSGDAVTFTAGAADADERLLILDLVKPQKQFVRGQLVVGTANAPISGVIAIRYKGAVSPITQGSDVLDSAVLTSPAEV